MVDAKLVPTSPSGYADDAVLWQSVLAEWGEQVPDLLWPSSVWTYAQMRRDPQLAGILKALSLPIRRATWQIDPAGCRPEVAQLVADDLGLPVAGVEKPGARKVRGVSWTEHVRMSLLMLVYGHMPFELVAEIRDGQARLTQLAERMPSSIGEIRVHPDGSLAGINQNALPGIPGPPQIDVDRLVWYSHEREGSAWQGQSVLRPAFAPWLLKREMQRVHATSNRRFGAGVPVMQPQPGTAPTPQQQAAAQEAASAIRVGDQGGMAGTPGYTLQLMGLSGAVPDTLSFMRWLDQQMSRMALAGFLDLGDTPNGSRALGDSFIDLFLMSLQSVAEYVADTATRQAAARLVEWNWGEDEPVPAVTVADVGSQHSVTAESIQALITSGALTTDSELEAWIRREYRLPPKPPEPEPKPAPKPPTPPVPPGTDGAGDGQDDQTDGADSTGDSAGTAPAAGGKVTARRRPMPGQMELPIAAAAADPATDDEQHQQDWQAAQDRLQQAWDAGAGTALTAGILAALVAALGTGGGLAALGQVTAPAGDVTVLADALHAQMVILAADGAKQATAEVQAQGVTAPAAVADDTTLRQVAEVTAAVIAAGMVNGAIRAATSAAASAVPGAGPVDSDALQEAAQVALDGTAGPGGGGWVADNTGAALTTAQAAGRAAVFAAVEQAGHTVTFAAREHNDAAECLPCREIDGHAYDTLAAALADYPAGRYRDCAGGMRCRGRLVAEIHQ